MGCIDFSIPIGALTESANIMILTEYVEDFQHKKK